MLEAMPAFHHLDDPLLDQNGRVQIRYRCAAIQDAAFCHLAAFGMQQIGDRLQRCRLASAIAAKKGGNATFWHLQRYALQHQNDVIVDHLDIIHIEKGFCLRLVIQHDRLFCSVVEKCSIVDK